MRSRLLAIGLTIPLAASLAACASTVDGQGSAGSAPASAGAGASSGASGSSSSGASPSGSGSGSASPAVSLAAQLGQGITKIKTTHLNLQIGVSGHVISGRGDERVSDGKVLALDLTEAISGSLTLRLVLVGGHSYLKLPASLNHSGKPWQLVTASSSNPVVRQLAGSLSSTQNSASLSNFTSFVAAARSVTRAGTGTRFGVPTTKYAVDVDPAKLPDSYQGKQQIVSAGVTSIPVTITLDSQGRPVLVTDHVSVSGQSVDARVSLGNFNAPVKIVAPPRSQVSTR